MLDTPDAVLIYMPLMEHLGMSWNEIKNTPKHELRGLLSAYNEYKVYHSMDGYTDQQVSEMAKENPQVRSNYTRYLETQRKYHDMIGKNKSLTFKDI